MARFWIVLFAGGVLSLFCGRLAIAQDKPAADDVGNDEKFTGFVLKGFEKENQNDFAGALEFYTKALDVKSDSAAILIRKAYVVAKLGQYGRAAHDLRTATAAQPVSVTDYLTAAWLRATCPFSTLRDGVLAVAYAQKALNEQPSPEAYDMLAAGYAEMGNYGKAQENIRAAIKLFPDSPRIPALKQRLILYQSRKPWREVWGEDEKKQAQELQRTGN